MEQKKVLWAAYAVLLLLVVFVLGFIAGKNKNSPSVQVIYEMQQPAPAAVQFSGEQAMEGLINLNTADAALLDTLPGIGPELAQRIVEYRDTYGRFVDLSQIMDVEGIGEKRFEELKPLITLGGNE